MVMETTKRTVLSGSSNLFRSFSELTLLLDQKSIRESVIESGQPFSLLALAHLPLTKSNQIKAELIETSSIVKVTQQLSLLGAKGFG
jgi:hypothetical protein